MEESMIRREKQEYLAHKDKSSHLQVWLSLSPTKSAFRKERGLSSCLVLGLWCSCYVSSLRENLKRIPDSLEFFPFWSETKSPFHGMREDEKNHRKIHDQLRMRSWNEERKGGDKSETPAEYNFPCFSHSTCILPAFYLHSTCESSLSLCLSFLFRSCNTSSGEDRLLQSIQLVGRGKIHNIVRRKSQEKKKWEGGTQVREDRRLLPLGVTVKRESMRETTKTKKDKRSSRRITFSSFHLYSILESFFAPFIITRHSCIMEGESVDLIEGEWNSFTRPW